MTMITFWSDGPSSARSASARITAGKACTVSMTTMSALSTQPPR